MYPYGPDYYERTPSHALMLPTLRCHKEGLVNPRMQSFGGLEVFKTLNPYTLNPQPYTLNPEPEAQKLEAQTLSPEGRKALFPTALSRRISMVQGIGAWALGIRVQSWEIRSFASRVFKQGWCRYYAHSQPSNPGPSTLHPRQHPEPWKPQDLNSKPHGAKDPLKPQP